jgi:hypothetical protein
MKSKILFIYFKISSIIMLTISIVYGYSAYTNWQPMNKFNLLVAETPFSFVIYGLFMISMFNIFICGITGLIFLTKRHEVKWGIFFIASAISYAIFLRTFGDGL